MKNLIHNSTIISIIYDSMQTNRSPYSDISNNGLMVYKNGEGVPQDDTLAHMWWNIAGSKGHEEATDKRVLLEKIMTESQIKKANELARKRKSKM